MAVIVGAGVVLALLYFLAVDPYLNSRDDLIEQRSKLLDRKKQVDALFASKRHLTPIWADMLQGGLRSSPGDAEQQAYQAVLDWAQNAGFGFGGLKPDKAVQQQNGFEVLSFHVSGTGSNAQLARMLWSMETASIPIRLVEIQITPRREGFDELAVQLTVSTVCRVPDSAVPAKPVASAGAAANAWGQS